MFPCFNILVYAQNHVLKAASSTDTLEQARDSLYELYELALKLEPKPERPEPTTAQIQMINRARSFVTMKMRKRQNLREFKANRKQVINMRSLIGQRLQKRIEELKRGPAGTKTPDTEPEDEDDDDDVHADMKKLLMGGDLPDEDDEWEPGKVKPDDEADEVVNIEVPKKKKKAKKRAAPAKEDEGRETNTKRVRFDLSKNKVTEFFKQHIQAKMANNSLAQTMSMQQSGETMGALMSPDRQTAPMGSREQLESRLPLSSQRTDLQRILTQPSLAALPG